MMSEQTRKVAAGLAVITLGVCAVALTVTAGPESLSAAQSEDSIQNVVPKVRALAKSMQLDESADNVNANAIVAAFTPFLGTKDEAELKAIKQFDSDAKYGEVKKYQTDIDVILKGVQDEYKVLKEQTLKPDKDPHH
mmetsp:Transcript_15830/g.25181  ORF Transcript_15830/g.25181 Transcript_15830/m.25181 type:complete len:137 (+) Transcript_15830:9-419(+)